MPSILPRLLAATTLAAWLLVNWAHGDGAIVLDVGSNYLPVEGDSPLPVGSVEATATGQTTVTLNWTDDSQATANATSFLVERSLNGSSWTEVDSVTTTTLNDSGLSAGTLYYYRVTSGNFWGDAAPLSTTVTTHSAGSPTAPSNLAATAISSSSISLTWTDNSNNETGFELQRATNSGFSTGLQTFTPAANATSYTDSGLTAATEYFYRIRAVNGSGNSAYSATDSDTTEAAGSAAFALTAVPDATVGVTSDIAAWYTEYANPSQWWMWQVRTVDLADSGTPGLLIVSHRTGNGARLYAGNGAFGFTENTATYDIDWSDLVFTTGGYLAIDFDHNEKTDLVNYGEGAVKNAIYDHGAGSLTVTSAPWVFEGLPHLVINKIEEQQPSGYLKFTTAQAADWPTTLDRTQFVYAWNGSAYVETKTTISPPTGIPTAVLDDMESYLDDGSHDVLKRYLEFYYVTDFDLDGDGTNDLIIQLAGSYGGALRGWYLTNNGDGTYTDRTAAWGLPNEGIPIFIRQKEFGRPFEINPGWTNTHAHIDVGNGTRPDLFIANIEGSSFGHYRWNGSGYSKVTGSLTTRLGLDDSYQKRLYAVDLTNSGHLDLILSRPRSGLFYIFLNDGSGNFTEYNPGRQLYHWDSDGLCIDDLDGDGLPEFILGGDGGSDSGVTSSTTARCLSVWENTTTSPGSYLGVKIRRTGHENFFGVGARVDVHTAGQSFSAASLIRRWYARPDGLPVVFGVGGAATVDVRVTWPDASTDDQTGVVVNQIITEDGA